MAATPSVVYSQRLGIVTIQGPGGFTEFRTTERQAEAIAIALGVPFKLLTL